MQKVARRATQPDTSPPTPRTHQLDVEIAAIATGNPAHRLSQTEAVRHAKDVFPHFDRLESLFANTGIHWRYTCAPVAWCRTPHGWQERNAEFKRHALDLLADVATRAADAAGISFRDIGALVVNTTTGFSVPSLDALLINRLRMNEATARLPVFGFGCGGGAAGMARAAELTAAMPNRTTLFLTIELCSLFARMTNPSLGAFVSSALFGDGAAAVLLRKNSSGGRPKIRAVGEWCSPKTEHVLGYTIRDDGFGIVLSAELPKLLSRDLGPAVDTFLAGQGLTRASLDGHIFHPGGRKILEAAESVLGANFTGLDHAWGVLRDFGNMSSVGIIFVLARALAAGISGRYLLSAFGPGFSTYFVLIEV